MNRIGFSLLLGILLIGASCRSQSFFWSHNCCCTEVDTSCLEYGLLYNWYAATDTRNIANDGWHVMLYEDMFDLVYNVSGNIYDETDFSISDMVNYVKLKDTGLIYWAAPNIGTNEFMFNARGSGTRNYDGVFNYLTKTFTTQTSDQRYSGERDEPGALSIISFPEYSTFMLSVGFISRFLDDYELRFGRSIRLVKDSTTLTHGQTGTYVGNDGRAYRTICIGNREWLADNLMETKFRNNDIIQWYGANPVDYFTDAEWEALDTSAVCAYNNDVSNVGCDFQFPSVEYTDVNYGYLYNWYAATDIREIYNTGWHVPTKTEMQTLQTYLGGNTISGGKLKETGVIYYNPNIGATNEVLFNSRGSGQRLNDGTYAGLQIQHFVMSATALYSLVETVLNIYGSGANTVISDANNYKKEGLSIRLIKDSTTLSDGQAGTYVGNDGKIYPTICIGTQEWLAYDLCETEYNNGDPVVEVTDNATWAGLTTGARCSYNNDETNAINP